MGTARRASAEDHGPLCQEKVGLLAEGIHHVCTSSLCLGPRQTGWFSPLGEGAVFSPCLLHRVLRCPPEASSQTPRSSSLSQGTRAHDHPSPRHHFHRCPSVHPLSALCTDLHSATLSKHLHTIFFSYYTCF